MRNLFWGRTDIPDWIEFKPDGVFLEERIRLRRHVRFMARGNKKGENRKTSVSSIFHTGRKISCILRDYTHKSDNIKVIRSLFL